MFDLPKKLIKGLIVGYSYFISPLTPARCRFHPTCSAYALEAVDRHGNVKGSLMAAKRLLRCHPWHESPMLDPVPAIIDWAQIIGYKRSNAARGKNCGGDLTERHEQERQN